ncbi:MAG: SAM-dependent chlorinase/fluorinase [Nitrospirota bacterium]
MLDGQVEHPARYFPLAKYKLARVPPSLRLITLLTDFGNRDWFVASMKGAILTINPHATIVDLSHQITPHRIDEAAYALKSCYREFPEGTIHVVVVDPGVGSARRAIAVKSVRYYFLTPDNGVLSYIFDDEQPVEVREIDQRKFRRESPGHTFDGRDLFAPVAGRLARHEPFESYGPVIGDYLTFPISEPHWEQGTLVGEIVYVDRFGNLMSNLMPVHLEEACLSIKRRQPRIQIGGQIIEGLVNSYSEALAEKLSALINSAGALEIFLKEASAAGLLQVGKGARIEVS